VSSLVLVRHGQASFGAADYDVLSPLGAEQAAALGRHLVARGKPIDALYAGPRRRHLDTARHLIAGAAEAEVALPEPTVLDGLDEYPAIELLRRWLPRLGERDPALAAALAAGDRRRYQEAFESIVDQWVRGELTTDDDLESYGAFANRVEAALAAIMGREGRGRRIAVVTSGGPVAMALRACLGLADVTALRLAWVVANASYSELRYRDGALSLIGFNHVGHLDDRLTTYR
jgi:broad specificity phosphatase PhoE